MVEEYAVRAVYKIVVIFLLSFGYIVFFVDAIRICEISKWTYFLYIVSIILWCIGVIFLIKLDEK